MRTLKLVLALLIAAPAFAADVYIRDGGTGNGSAWNNALDVLPNPLTRGNIYWFADGAYPCYVFNDAESGTQLITLKKATVADHGTETGWLSTYGDGQATISQLNDRCWHVQTGYWTFDGNGTIGTPIGTYGFRFDATIGDPVPPPGNRMLSIGTSVSADLANITVKHVEFDGNDINFVDAVHINWVSNLLFHNIYGHDIEDDLFEGCRPCAGSGVTFEYITSRDSTPAGTAESHPDTFDLYHGTTLTVRYSNVDHASQMIFVAGNNPLTEGFTTINAYGNLLYSSLGNIGDGGPKCISLRSTIAMTVNFHNNTCVGATFGIGLSSLHSGVVKNNIFMNIVSSTGMQFGATTHDYNWVFNNTQSTTEAHLQTGTAHPFVDFVGPTLDFHLAAATNAGDSSIGAAYDTDDLGDAGITRGADGVRDRGAYEFEAAVSPVPDLLITTLTCPGGTVDVVYFCDVDAGGGELPYTYTLLSGALPTGTFLASENKGNDTNLLSDSANFVTGLDCSNLWDGNTDVIPNTSTAVTASTSMFCELDLGASLALKLARAWGDEGGNSRCDTWTLEYKVLVGDPYTAAFSNQDCSANQWFYQGLAVSGRYVKVTFNGPAGGTQVAELEVYTNDSTSPSGVIVGTPSAGGTFQPVIRVTDSQSPTPDTDDQSFTVVADAPIVIDPINIISTSPLPPCREGLVYGFQFESEGGAGGNEWTAVGTWPDGLSLNSAGVLSGTPSAVESQTLDVTVTDDGMDDDTVSFNIVCAAAVVLRRYFGGL